MSWLLVKRFPLWLSIILTAVVFALLGWAGASVWYWEQLHLKFDSSIFSDIFGPLFSLAGVVVYGVTLGYLIQQNRIQYSNTIKPHFEHQYSSLLGHIGSFSYEDPFKEEMIFFKDIPMYVMNQADILYSDAAFNDSVNKLSQMQEPFSKDVYKELDEHSNNLSLRLIKITDLADSPLSDYLRVLQRIKKFITEVQKSRLLEDEKTNWQKRVYNELLQEILLLNYAHLFIPRMHHNDKVPRIFSPTHDLEFTSIREFRIFDFYRWFEVNVESDKHDILR